MNILKYNRLTNYQETVSKIQIYQEISLSSVQYEKLYRKYHIDNDVDFNSNL